MTPQDLVSEVLTMNEEQGRVLITTHLPLFSDAALNRCVYLLKKAADQQWNHHGERSFLLSGHLILIGELTQNVFYHALGVMARGDALRRLDRDQEALAFFDEAGEKFLSLGDEVSWARTRIGRVSACLRLNRTAEALQDSELARDIFIRHGKFLRAGQIDVNAAIVNYELGQFDQALLLFDRAIATYLLVGDSTELYIARARGNKALSLAAQGKFREAVSLHEQARSVFLAHGESEEVSMAREDLNIADIYAAQGHYGQALYLYNRSRAIFLRHEMAPSAAEVAQQLCSCLFRLNRMHEAYELVEQTVAFFREAPGQRHNLARSLILQAVIAPFITDFSVADSLLAEAIALLHEGGFVRLAALARLRRAELYFATHQFPESLHEAEEVADAFAEQEDLPHLAQVMLLQGRIADAMGDSETAYECCDQALDIARGQEILDLRYRCYDLLGQLEQRRGDLTQAIAYYDQAVQGIEEVQSRLILDERTTFLEDKGSVYMRAVTLALHLEQPEQALIYVEKAKSRVLGDYLRSNIDIHFRFGDHGAGHLFDQLTALREEQAWFSSIAYDTDHQTSLSDTGALRRIAVGGPDNARREMHKRERQIEQMIELMQMHASGGSLMRLRSSWTNSIVTSLWPRLEKKTVLLEYYLAENDIHLFVMRRSGIEVRIAKGGVPTLTRLISLWRTNLDLAGQAAGSPAREQQFVGLQANCLGLMGRLYDLLLRPVADILEQCEHIILVPYGPLHYLPFHALFDGKQFIIEHHIISYLPSAALWDICLQRGERSRKAGFAREKALIMGHSSSGHLISAVQEAEVVARQLGVSSAIDEAATAALLLEAGPTCSLVHIAAHGLFRLDAPNFSYIQLAERQFGTIEAFNLNLDTCTLVVLSACETGRAVVGGVDEVIGLGRGFLYAGAASLVPTFWKIDDVSSAELMEMFYRALLRGKSKVMALAEAQRAFLTRIRNSTATYRIHPYFWAAFHLIGDTGPLF